MSIAASRDPSRAEAADVIRLSDLREAMSAIGALRLLYGENPLLQLIAESEKPGALRPSVARASMTREAHARERRRRLQVRSHNRDAFLRAIKR